MRILVVGAGAIGGYFGGRLLEARQDVTFLVRQRRASQLDASGLTIRSRFGDVSISRPPAVLKEDIRQPFDLVLLSCKAYDLEDAMDSFSAAVGPGTSILPMLNGMRHIDVLAQRFGRERVLGGWCLIAATLNDRQEIAHLNDTHHLSFGELDGSHSPRVAAIESVLSSGRFESRLSRQILHEMWEKWVFIASGAALTCLMRASVGDIVAAGASDLAATLLNECAAIAAHAGYPTREPAMQRSRSMLTQAGSTLTASMLRDLERGAPIEADHVIGDLLRRGEAGAVNTPLLRVAGAHLRAYEARRAREVAAGKAA